MPFFAATASVAGVTATKGQSAEQQQKDISECQALATQSSGYDPSATPAVSSAPQAGGRLKGAAKGAAAGAVVAGATGGDVYDDPQGRFTIRTHGTPHTDVSLAVRVESASGALGYTGDTGPSDRVAESMHGVDLLLVEAALSDLRFDDEERGHLTPEEALELARAAEARSTLLVHYGPARRPELDALCAASGIVARPAVDGAVVTVSPADAARRPLPVHPTAAAG